MIFFADRSLGKQFPTILEAAGLRVERHDEHFRQDAPDEAWLRKVGQKGWVAVTRDRRIRYKPNELAAVVAHNVGLLVVIGSVPTPELARAFVATLGAIERFVARTDPPFIAKLYRASASELATNPEAAGRIEVWYPKAD